MGFFIGSHSSILQKEKTEETVSGLLNSDLLRELDSLVGLIEDTCKMPESTHLDSAALLLQVKSLAAEDHVSVMNEVAVRVGEFRERLSLLSFGESVEFVCTLKRLEGCEERLLAIFDRKVPMESFWVLMREVKCNLDKEEEKTSAAAAVAAERRVGRGSLSARYERRRRPSNSEAVILSSGRLFSVSIPSAELYG